MPQPVPMLWTLLWHVPCILDNSYRAGLQDCREKKGGVSFQAEGWLWALVLVLSDDSGVMASPLASSSWRSNTPWRCMRLSTLTFISILLGGTACGPCARDSFLQFQCSP